MAEETKKETASGTLTWKGGLAFDAVSGRNGRFEFKGGEGGGLTPTEAILLSLAGCMSMDVVSILEKKRVDIKSYSASIEGERNADYPKFFKSAVMTIRIKGGGLDEAKLDKAIELSRDKYCSVLHSMRPDFKLEVRTAIEN